MKSKNEVRFILSGEKLRHFDMLSKLLLLRPSSAPVADHIKNNDKPRNKLKIGAVKFIIRLDYDVLGIVFKN